MCSDTAKPGSSPSGEVAEMGNQWGAPAVSRVGAGARPRPARGSERCGHGLGVSGGPALSPPEPCTGHAQRPDVRPDRSAPTPPA